MYLSIYLQNRLSVDSMVDRSWLKYSITIILLAMYRSEWVFQIFSFLAETYGMSKVYLIPTNFGKLLRCLNNCSFPNWQDVVTQKHKCVLRECVERYSGQPRFYTGWQPFNLRLILPWALYVLRLILGALFTWMCSITRWSVSRPCQTNIVYKTNIALNPNVMSQM